MFFILQDKNVTSLEAGNYITVNCYISGYFDSSSVEDLTGNVLKAKLV